MSGNMLHKLHKHFQPPLTSPPPRKDFVVWLLQVLLKPLVLFLWHHNGESYDVLRLLHRGHVNHAAAEGERALSKGSQQRGESRREKR